MTDKNSIIDVSLKLTFPQSHRPGTFHGTEQTVARRVAALCHPIYFGGALGHRAARQGDFVIHGADAHGRPVQVTLHRLACLLVDETPVSILVAGRVAVMQTADQVTAAAFLPGSQAFQLLH